MILFLIIINLIFSQQNLTFNIESKYGNGTNINDLSQQELPYSYFENLMDISFAYNNIFLFTQLEYSNSPVYGYDKKLISDLLNTYYIEIYKPNYLFKYGHLQTLYGYGLSINMFQDQSTDFDNRIKGLEFIYTPANDLELFILSGSGNYGIKSTGESRINDLQFNHEVNLYGAQFYTPFGDILASISNAKTEFKGGMLNDYTVNQPFMSSDTRLSRELQDYQSEITFPTFNEEADQDNYVNLNSLNIGYSNTLSIFDIYYEKSINTYNKILRKTQDQEGYFDYFSLSTDLYGMNFLYEFKDYNMLYYMPILSNPPLGYMETSSVLMSRNQHTINFSDEIGHQFETRFNINNISFIINLSFGSKHKGIEYSVFDPSEGLITSTYNKVNWYDILTMDFLNEDLVAHKPFRDIYGEFSGWNKSNTFYYKLGLGSQFSYDNISSKNYQSFIIPTQFVYKLANNNSFTIYYENQKLDNLFADVDWDSFYEREKYKNNYLSISYNINKIGSLSYFFDQEIKQFYNSMNQEISSKNSNWTGFEFNFLISSSTQLSIFKGSQKGGLVCANGICAIQPSFEDGIKLTFRSTF